ncbi:hypothetical protein GCM10010399_15300 [Dactylosporangium fulvum]|uniref:Uncharacterized protein n=1 Tax=Dactylosporangium fulvum TaxID=53359 RepID=A0ABY5VSD4_9ACTN|nr:hypothetical protein [Dactylosporangium fulvum]UWP80190.1 hypothetical protein Dfulv_34210 [Dactylosporangium fulvum]
MTGPVRQPSAYCRACPIRRFRVGAFDVEARPKSSTRFDREKGVRTIPESGVPVCVHPDRIGVPPGAYASASTPLPYLWRLWLRIRLAVSSGARPR